MLVAVLDSAAALAQAAVVLLATLQTPSASCATFASRDFYPSSTPSPRFYAIDAIQQNILLPRPPVSKLEALAPRVEERPPDRLRSRAAVQRSQTCRGGVSRDALSRARIWHLASVRRRRRRPFERKGLLLMLHPSSLVRRDACQGRLPDFGTQTGYEYCIPERGGHSHRVACDSRSNAQKCLVGSGRE